MCHSWSTPGRIRDRNSMRCRGANEAVGGGLGATRGGQGRGASFKHGWAREGSRRQPAHARNDVPHCLCLISVQPTTHARSIKLTGRWNRPTDRPTRPNLNVLHLSIYLSIASIHTGAGTGHSPCWTVLRGRSLLCWGPVPTCSVSLVWCSCVRLTSNANRLVFSAFGAAGRWRVPRRAGVPEQIRRKSRLARCEAEGQAEQRYCETDGSHAF